MTRDAITHNDAGELVVPATVDDWRPWVAATRTRNFCEDRTLADWLRHHGAAAGFLEDIALPGYDQRTDFNAFVMAQGNAFEAAVLRHLGAQAELRVISRGWDEIQSLERAEETFSAMAEGVPVIVQGVLRNPQTRTYGAPDLLVRSDQLLRLFPGTLTFEEAAQVAPDLRGARWHYRVVDIKFSTLGLLRDGALAAEHLDYMVQLHLYNQALGRLQGLTAPAAYVMGRGWKQGTGDCARGRGSMERLGRVDHDRKIGGKPISVTAAAAVEWIRRVRIEAAGWSVLPSPSVPELYPNPGANGYPWASATREIARQLEDVSLVWQIGHAHAVPVRSTGLTRWTDPACTSATLGLSGKLAVTADAILEVNRTTDGPPVRPERIRTEEQEWRPQPPVEFYVDFEYVNNLDDDFSRIPEQGGHDVIFMIGCGHLEEGLWQFSSFTADDLEEPSEAAIIDAWLAHMAAVRTRLGAVGEPYIYCWSAAEGVSFDTSYKAARKRHPDRNWPEPRWFDFLKRVMKEEPVVVRGAMKFGLKEVARAFHALGLIQTDWPEGPGDGLAAMTAAWYCNREAHELGGPLSVRPLMQAVVKYNEIDCRAIMEIVRYLRLHH